MSDKIKFPVMQNLTHNNKRYFVGTEISLTPDEARAIGPKTLDLSGLAKPAAPVVADTTALEKRLAEAAEKIALLETANAGLGTQIAELIRQRDELLKQAEAAIDAPKPKAKK